MNQIFNLFDFKQKVDYKTEVLSGLTVALALVPEAVAFAMIAGLAPLTGLYAAFVMGLVTSILGGRPGMISGATGAVAVVIVSLAASHGVEYIFATVILAGILQMTVGFLRLGKLMRLVPHPAIFGFVNGLAVIIFMSQLDQFKAPSGEWLSGESLYIILGLVSESPQELYGQVRVYKKPKPHHEYIMTVDVAEGKGMDYSTFTIFDIHHGDYFEQVATFRDNLISLMLLPDICAKYGKLYNDALIIVENNNQGSMVCRELYYELEYENMFMTSSVKADGIGVRMTQKVKAQGCAALRDIMEENKLNHIGIVDQPNANFDSDSLKKGCLYSELAFERLSINSIIFLEYGFPLLIASCVFFILLEATNSIAEVIFFVF